MRTGTRREQTRCVRRLLPRLEALEDRTMPAVHVAVVPDVQAAIDHTIPAVAANSHGANGHGPGGPASGSAPGNSAQSNSEAHRDSYSQTSSSSGSTDSTSSSTSSSSLSSSTATTSVSASLGSTPTASVSVSPAAVSVTSASTVTSVQVTPVSDGSGSSGGTGGGGGTGGAGATTSGGSEYSSATSAGSMAAAVQAGNAVAQQPASTSSANQGIGIFLVGAVGAEGSLFGRGGEVSVMGEANPGAAARVTANVQTAGPAEGSSGWTDAKAADEVFATALTAESVELPSERELTPSDVAGSLLGVPRADILPQGGSRLSAVATVITNEDVPANPAATDSALASLYMSPLAGRSGQDDSPQAEQSDSTVAATSSDSSEDESRSITLGDIGLAAVVILGALTWALGAVEARDKPIALSR
jgi:hypothetical protein